jgi:Mg2+-importing ATPase
MIRFILVMVPAVLLINGLTKGDWLEALLFAVAVAVGLTPERLPMIVTVNLAKGAIERVIVKRLHAIQNFGAMDVLCTDKTGTLTPDRIILKLRLDIRGNNCERVLEFAYLNSHYQARLKNLLDVRSCSMSSSAKTFTCSANTRTSTNFPSTSCVGALRPSVA